MKTSKYPICWPAALGLIIGTGIANAHAQGDLLKSAAASLLVAVFVLGYAIFTWLSEKMP